MNYRAIKSAEEPDFLAVMLVHDDEVEVYQERGAEFIIGSIEDVLGCLPEKMDVR